MEALNIDIVQRERTMELYHNINNLYESVHQMFDGVFFEVLVEPRELGLRSKIQFIIKAFNNCEVNKANNPDINVELRERLRLIEELHDNYEALVDSALTMLAKIKEDYPESHYKVTLIRRRENEMYLDPQYEAEENEEDEEEAEEEEDEEEAEEEVDEEEAEEESESEWECDSGLDSETDSQSEHELESDLWSDPESGFE